MTEPLKSLPALKLIAQSQAEAIRRSASRGYSKRQLMELYNVSMATVMSAVKHQGKRGRPPFPKCPHCGKPLRKQHDQVE